MFFTKYNKLGEYDSFIGKLVLDFTKENDINTLPVGSYYLINGCYVNVDEYDTRENDTFEAHRQYIDVQLLVDGEEEILCAPLLHGKETLPYDGKKDIAFYSCNKGPYCSVKLTPGMAVVLLPWDMHAPCNAKKKRRNRKLVFKIPTELVLGNRKTRIACCGDSITFGLMATDPQISYPSVLQQLIGEAYRVGNFGKSGATVISDYEEVVNRYLPYLKTPEYAAALMSEPDIVVVMLGMNDGNPTHHFNEENGGAISENYLNLYKETYQKLLDNIRSLPQKPQIYMAKTTAMKRVVGEKFSEDYIKNFNENLKKIRQVQEQIAKEQNITLIETVNDRENLEFYQDGCHLSDAGYEQLASVIAKILKLNNVL